MEDEAKKIKEGYERYAKSAGIRLNPDGKIVDAIVAGIIRNEKKHGARYCPCRLVSGEKEEDRKNICPCVYHKDEIAKDGHCHCRLFFK
jgi:ferredoxin-thioredoxin reductase catalytic chain